MMVLYLHAQNGNGSYKKRRRSLMGGDLPNGGQFDEDIGCVIADSLVTIFQGLDGIYSMQVGLKLMVSS